MLHEPNASSPLTPHTVQFASASEGTSAIAFARLSPQQVFAREGLEQLNRRSNIKGAVQAIAHLSLLGASGYCWMTHTDQLWIGLPALVLYGFAVAATFMPLHECVHRTAFANRRANDLIAWLAGVLSFYNSTFYRRYHQWHHRYTRIPNKDPELTDLIPSNWREYLLHVSGIPWWMGKLQTHFLCATGQMAGFSYIPETARREVQRSMQLQLMVYGCAIAACVYFRQTWFVLGWLLPLAVDFAGGAYGLQSGWQFVDQYSDYADLGSPAIIVVEYALSCRASFLSFYSVPLFGGCPSSSERASDACRGRICGC